MPQHDIGAAALARDACMTKITALSRPAGAAAIAAAGLLTVPPGNHAAVSRVRTGHGSDHGAVLIPAQPPHQAAGTGQLAPGQS